MSADGCWSRVGLTSALLLSALPTGAAEQAALVQGRDVVTMPGIGRVIFAFVLSAVLAVALAVVLKRILPRFGGRVNSSGSVRVIDRANLGGGVQVHVLQVDDEKVVVAQSRNGVALIALDKSREQA